MMRLSTVRSQIVPGIVPVGEGQEPRQECIQKYTQTGSEDWLTVEYSYPFEAVDLTKTEKTAVRGKHTLDSLMSQESNLN